MNNLCGQQGAFDLHMQLHLIRRLDGTLTIRKWRHREVDGSGFGVCVVFPALVCACCFSALTGDASSLHAVFRTSSATYTGRQPQNRVMAPLCPRLPWLLKRTDCLHRANIFWGTSHGFHQRPLLWKRNVGAVGPLWPQHPTARSFAASAHGGSPDGHDLTEKLWSFYHKTKKHTEGI